MREKYYEVIEPFIDKQVIKVLVGQRRVGKSLILQSIIQKLISKGVSKENIISINKEDEKFGDILNFKDLNLYIKSQLPTNSKKVYLFIDEVQEIEEFEKSVRSFNLHENFDIFITGSNSSILSSDLATYLGGRYVEFLVHPLDFNEFLDFNSITNDQKTLEEYLRYGGMPFLSYLDKSDETVSMYLNSLVDSVVLKDIVKRFKVRKIKLLQQLIVFLADNVSGRFSAKKISDYLKQERISITPKQILEYVGYLQGAFLVHKVEKRDIGGKQILRPESKYYFNDIGIRNALLEFRNIDYPKILENIVFMHLKSKGYKVHIGDIKGREVDFVAEKSSKKLYIQVCYLLNSEEVREREFGNLLEIMDAYPKYVVSMDPITEDYLGVRHMHIKDFLTDKTI